MADVENPYRVLINEAVVRHSLAHRMNPGTLYVSPDVGAAIYASGIMFRCGIWVNNHLPPMTVMTREHLEAGCISPT